MDMLPVRRRHADFFWTRTFFLLYGKRQRQIIIEAWPRVRCYVVYDDENRLVPDSYHPLLFFGLSIWEYLSLITREMRPIESFQSLQGKPSHPEHSTACDEIIVLEDMPRIPQVIWEWCHRMINGY
jgi:hypothetical protein